MSGGEKTRGTRCAFIAGTPTVGGIPKKVGFGPRQLTHSLHLTFENTTMERSERPVTCDKNDEETLTDRNTTKKANTG